MILNITAIFFSATVYAGKRRKGVIQKKVRLQKAQEEEKFKTTKASVPAPNPDHGADKMVIEPLMPEDLDDFEYNVLSSIMANGVFNELESNRQRRKKEEILEEMARIHERVVHVSVLLSSLHGGIIRIFPKCFFSEVEVWEVGGWGSMYVGKRRTEQVKR